MMRDTLYFIEIKEAIDPHIVSQLLARVSSERRAKISKFRFDMDQKLSLLSELLVRILICRTTELRNDQITFTNNQYGKPYLIDQPDICFNISHTRNAIAVLLSDKPVGVDIEKINKADLEIANRYFTGNEFNYIIGSTEGQDERFYRIWTKKEAFIKCMGKGLSIPLRSFDVLSEELKGTIKTFDRDGYLISACSKDVSNSFEVVGLSQSEIISMALEISP